MSAPHQTGGVAARSAELPAPSPSTTTLAEPLPGPTAGWDTWTWP